MSTCPSCGTENPEVARFCLACGASLVGPEDAEVRKTVTVVFSDVAGVDRPRANNWTRSRSERVMTSVLRTVACRDRASRRHRREVHRRCGHGGVRYPDPARGRRAARGARGRRDAGVDAGVQRRIASVSWGFRLAIRIGVNTGEVVAGDPSTGQALVTGDTVNVAARLEQAATPGEILIGETTYRLVRDADRSRSRSSLWLSRASRTGPRLSPALGESRARGIEAEDGYPDGRA